ncbi:Endonuclease/exonuclease/phosphatase [Quillaja saponaria]|uniref:Endonuclease/exonuclease/phosphatase n=1 Tax=Quillaja saponaria TaxID=32244 RepID=A0AAD7LUL8_QUISA|nr:Endonuclease/exonuclease/phosphatase [Quillaja saponaria]
MRFSLHSSHIFATQLAYEISLSQAVCPCRREGEEGFLSRPFKLKQMWTRDSISTLVIECAWKSEASGSLVFIANCKLIEFRRKLKDWNQNQFKSVESNIKRLNAIIDNLQCSPPFSSNLQLEADL